MSSAAEKPDPPERRPTWTGRIVATLLGLVLLGGLAEGLVRAVMPEWRAFDSRRFMRLILVPGYGTLSIGSPGFDGMFAQNNGDFRVRVRINDFGLRNPEPIEAAAGRIWILGDSMAFGWGVAEADTYTSVIARISKRSTYNVASPGAAVCGYQALLARMPARVRPSAVILGLVLENDLHAYDCRAWAKRVEKAWAEGAPKHGIETFINVKHLFTQRSAFYNFLAVSLKRVDFVRELLTWIGIIEQIHPYRRQIDEAEFSGAAERTAEEVLALRRMLPSGTPFAVLIAPARFEIRDGDPFFEKLRLAMVEALRARDIDVIDPLAAFLKAGFAATHFAHDGHWSPAGHKVAGAYAARWVRSKLPPGGAEHERR